MPHPRAHRHAGTMGFKYVLIPASASEPMQELEYHSEILDLQKDCFREFLEKYFAKLGASVDRAMLMDQLRERTGVDLQDKTAKGEVPQEALDRLLNATSVEIFPVMLPTKATQFEGVSLYVDDKGVSKNLEENPRAAGLIQACGFPAQTFRGDCFIGRIYDDNEDEWRRIDLALKDCSTDAGWVQTTRKQRENRSSGDMASLAAKIGSKNPAHITPSMLEDHVPKGETDQYRWRQTEEEVEVTFKNEGLHAGDKKQVKVAFSRQRLKVEVKGEVLIDVDLFGLTHADESTWTLSDGVLQVNLAKAGADSWVKLTK